MLNICIMVMGATVFGYVVANVSTLVQVDKTRQQGSTIVLLYYETRNS